MLSFMKDAAAYYLSLIDADGTSRIRWSGDATGIIPPGFRELTVTARREVFPGMMRMTFRASDLAPFDRDGLHVKLLLPPADRSPVWPTIRDNGMTAWPTGADTLSIRHYTIRAVRPETGELDIDLVMHDGGRASDWCVSAEPGDVAGMLGPGGGYVPPHDGPLLLAGDSTALPAIARILEHLPPHARGHVVIAAPREADEYRYLPASGLETLWLPTSARGEDFATAMMECAAKLRPAYGWFAGEHEAAQAVRRFFKSYLGLAKMQQLSVSYWRKGFAGGSG